MSSLPLFVKKAFQKLANGEFDDGLKELNQDLWKDDRTDLAGPFCLGFPFVQGWGEELLVASLLKRYSLDLGMPVKVFASCQVYSILKQDSAFQVFWREDNNKGRPPLAILRQALTGKLLEKDFKPLEPECQRSQQNRYRPRIGITWASINNGNPIPEKSVDLDQFRNILHGLNGDFVVLQRKLATGDAANLTQALGARIVPNEVLDAKCQSSLDALLAEIRQLDCLVTISTTTAHIAAALGIKVVLIAAQRKGPQWFWDVQANHQKCFYPSVAVHVGKGKTNDWWKTCLEPARLSLSNIISMQC